MSSLSPSPQVLASDASLVVTLIGSGLSSTSVRAIRFERAQTCTSDPAVSSGNVVLDVVGTPVTATQYQQMTISFTGTAGLGVGSWSLCVDWTVSATPSLQKVGALLALPFGMSPLCFRFFFHVHRCVSLFLGCNCLCLFLRLFVSILNVSNLSSLPLCVSAFLSCLALSLCCSLSL